VDWSQFGGEDFNFVSGSAGQRVTSDRLEKVKQLTRCRSWANSALGVEWYRIDPMRGHRLTELAFQQRLHQQRKEKGKKQ